MKIGIIGGSGLDNPDILEGRTEKFVDTRFGKPSDALIEGKIDGVDCIILARHGRNHSINPTKVNYRANIWALKEAGCTHVVVTTACGSLKEEIHPGDIVILDQFIDRTSKRLNTFYDGEEGSPLGVCHIPMHSPFCQKTCKVLAQTAESLNLPHHRKGTVITIEGPRFSTPAESRVFRTWQADVVNMTTVPEVILAKEAALSYAALAIVTDYDCWKDCPPVSATNVLEAFATNINNVTGLLKKSIPALAKENWAETYAQNRDLLDTFVTLMK